MYIYYIYIYPLGLSNPRGESSPNNSKNSLVLKNDLSAAARCLFTWGRSIHIGTIARGFGGRKMGRVESSFEMVAGKQPRPSISFRAWDQGACRAPAAAKYFTPRESLLGGLGSGWGSVRWRQEGSGVQVRVRCCLCALTNEGSRDIGH